MPADPPPPGQRPRDPVVQRPRPRRGEHQLIRPTPHSLRGRLPSGVQQKPGPPPLPIEPRGIGPSLIERSNKRLPSNRMQRSRRSDVKVSHGVTLRRAAR
ncbi:hypothetical protein STRAU_1454 [Streptomyces aurantiacus JA 4570]|uniref:Uncharacterized protein n=1 Tax=Streptomyces aurantiacus JA 4570 TaxID=1286094 RepID=S4AVK7_9ACTN|nr:hypothetical protein STRAU_1454 [Streptomyces aurantiacus JA 4570]